MANVYKNASVDLTTTDKTTVYTCPSETTAIIKSIRVTEDSGNDADQAVRGVLWLFNPSSTTYVKHYYSKTSSLFWGGGSPNPRTMSSYVSGYFNTTEAMTQVNFKFDSGNISSGDFKMYGISKS